MKGDYVGGQFTLADACWAGLCQVAMNSKGQAVSSRSRVNIWFAAVQSHPSTSKEAINPFFRRLKQTLMQEQLEKFVLTLVKLCY